MTEEFDYLNQSWDKPPLVLGPGVEFPRKAGKKLPNGSILLAETVVRTYDHRRDSIVLCVSNSVQPFITWHRMIYTDAVTSDGSYQIKDYCESGDYFSDIGAALDGYWKRIENLVGMV